MLEIGPRNNTIEFHLELENTTLDKIKSRLVVEVNNNITLIPLDISADGVVSGDIDLQESWNGQKGKVKLEVINESNYFSPFEKEVTFKMPRTFKTSAKEALPSSPVPLKETETYAQRYLRQQLEDQEMLKESRTVFTNLDLLDLNNEIDNFFKVK